MIYTLVSTSACVQMALARPARGGRHSNNGDSDWRAVTEPFSMSEAACRLHLAALEANGQPLALCVHLNLGKFKHTERDWSALMESVSKLFFGLLVLRSVEVRPSSFH